MGWHPDQTRRSGMADFRACYRGWMKGQGVDPDETVRPTLDDLDDLLARYPD